MRVVRKANEHNALARRSAHVDDADLLVREPQLIKLPIPLPTLPLVGNIVNKVIGGTSPTTTPKPQASTPAAQKPAPTTTTKAASPTTKATTPTTNAGGSATPTSGSGSSGGSTGGSTGGGTVDTGGSTGGSTSGSTAGDGSTSSGSTGAGTDTGTGGSSDPSTPSTGGSTDGSTSPATGTTDPNQPSTDPSGTASPGTVLTAGSSTEAGGTSADGTSIDTAAGSSGGSNLSSGTASGDGVSNAGQLPGSDGSSNGSGGKSGVKATGANGLPLPSGAVGGVGSGSGGGSSGGGVGGGDGANGGGKSGLSAGGVAGIVLLFIFLSIGIAIFIMRRRNNARRTDRSERWWFARKRVSKEFTEKDSATLWNTARQSQRSSFGTSADHFAASPPQFVDFDAIPSLPPVAGVGREDGTSPSLTTAFGITGDRRFSSGSDSSLGSGHGQWLMVTHRASEDTQADGLTPMSVRPFSPSESFAFPRPPDPDRNSAYSRPSSSGTVASGFRGTTPRTTSMSPTPPTPAIPAGVYLPGVKEHDPFADNNPFEDSNSAEGHQHAFVLPTGFAEQECIRRPFAPTLPDELAVTVGETVRLLRVFDDGWTFVERMKADSTPGIPADQGLIPLDCMREVGKDLPTFIAEKRVSGYAPSTGNGSFNAF